MKLLDIADIHTGIYRKPDLYGDTLYFQAKHFSHTGEIIAREKLTRELKSDPRLEKHLLKDKDILFAAKGEKNFAFLYSRELGEAVASSTFLVIRIKEDRTSLVTPEFLQWYLNHPFTQ